MARRPNIPAADLVEQDPEVDLARQERGDQAQRNVGMQAPGFIKAVHPEHGEPVVFVPGELLPEWAVTALNSGTGHYDPVARVFVVDQP